MVYSKSIASNLKFQHKSQNVTSDSYQVQEILLDCDQSDVLLARIIFSCILLSYFFVLINL